MYLYLGGSKMLSFCFGLFIKGSFCLYSPIYPLEYILPRKVCPLRTPFLEISTIGAYFF